jgi:hypothetical protein
MSTAFKPSQAIADWHELLSAVESNQGVHRISMETLRRLEGRQRVGKHILSSIEDKLKTLGLGHLPSELPNRQQQTVILYRVGTPASALVQAVQNGLNESPSSEAFEFLRRLNTLPDPEDVVSKEEIASEVQDATEAVLALLRRVKPTPPDDSVKDGNVYDLTAMLEANK